MYEMTEQEQAYYKACDIYDPATNFLHIFRCLMLSDWHDSPDTAASLICMRKDFIKATYIY